MSEPRGNQLRILAPAAAVHHPVRQQMVREPTAAVQCGVVGRVSGCRVHQVELAAARPLQFVLRHEQQQPGGLVVAQGRYVHAFGTGVAAVVF